MQEIPTPQGFLGIQICAPSARATHTPAPPDDNRCAENIARRRVNQVVKKICTASLKMRLACLNPTRIERIGQTDSHWRRPKRSAEVRMRTYRATRQRSDWVAAGEACMRRRRD